LSVAWFESKLLHVSITLRLKPFESAAAKVPPDFAFPQFFYGMPAAVVARSAPDLCTARIGEREKHFGYVFGTLPWILMTAYATPSQQHQCAQKPHLQELHGQVCRAGRGQKNQGGS
jgi:hypothetical protein